MGTDGLRDGGAPYVGLEVRTMTTELQRSRVVSSAVSVLFSHQVPLCAHLTLPFKLILLLCANV